MPLLVNTFISFSYIFRHLQLSLKPINSYTKFVSRGKAKANV